MPGDLNSPDSVTRILLVGFMGAGKSTVGPLLARSLGWEFVDVDRHIEMQAGSTVAAIFELEGETGFRRRESEAIYELVQRSRHVLALGGGALETASTRELLEQSPETCIVFLNAPLDTLLLRCRQSSEIETSAPIRPVLDELLKDRGRLEQRLAARLPYYQRAHLTIATGGLTAAEVSDRILAAAGASLTASELAAKGAQ